MTSPRYAVALEEADGERVAFTLPFDIAGGGLLAWMLNGALLISASATGGAGFSVPVGETPLAGDHVAALAIQEGDAVTQPIIEALSGDIDGINRIFSTSAPFLTGSLVCVLNGQWGGVAIESSDPETGAVTLTAERVPVVGDTLLAYYLPASGIPAASGGVLSGSISVLVEVTATLESL